MKVSIRTCVVCRRTGEKGDLARVVANGGKLIFDKDHRMPGRGAYVHRKAECMMRLAQQGRWERALRLRPGDLNEEALRDLSIEAGKEFVSADSDDGKKKNGSNKRRAVRL